MTNVSELTGKVLQIFKLPGFPTLEPALMQVLEQSLNEHLAKSMQEKEFHRRLNEDMLSGLHSIYKEIAKISDKGRASPKSSEPQSAEEASAIFKEVSRQLDEIMTTTLNAADDIMNNSEQIQANQQAAQAGLDQLRAAGADAAILAPLEKSLHENMEAVNSIVTALSFQDLTGQRIKKVVSALSGVHEIVVETYLSAGLMLKKSDEAAEKGFEALEQESRQAAAAQIKGSELKGPSLDASQKDVDDLLAQLGL